MHATVHSGYGSKISS